MPSASATEDRQSRYHRYRYHLLLLSVNFHGWTGFVMSNGCQGGPLCGVRAWWLNDTTVWVEEREEILLFLWARAGAGLMSPESPSWGEGGIFRTNSKYLMTPACHLRECPGHADQSPDTSTKRQRYDPRPNAE